MEDAHTHILALSEDKDAAFFAVYDGHGGKRNMWCHTTVESTLFI